MDKNISLGSKLKDRISGFTGVATALCLYLDAPSRLRLTSELLEGGKPVDVWFDINRLDVISR